MIAVCALVIIASSLSTVVESFVPEFSVCGIRTREGAMAGASSSSTSSSSSSSSPSEGCSSTSSSTSTSSAIDRAMHDTYDSLATRLIRRYVTDVANGRLRNDQLFVGIAGGPGSGKSTLSASVARLINERMDMTTSTSTSTSTTSRRPSMHVDDEAAAAAAATTSPPPVVVAPAAVVLPMDGFHYSRSQLMNMAGGDDDGGGGDGGGDGPASTRATYDELLARRGAPWTFDAEACVEAFTRARMTGEASLPIYSRIASDPVPDGVRLHPETRIVFLEGNYLLAWDDERWSPLRTNGVFDETWYVTCKSLTDQRRRLVRRHLETWTDEKTGMFGEGEAGAGAKADFNDMKNLAWIEEMSRKHADYVIESL
ncbi:hypothetical protein ACHAXA_004157 [Cyclostephanos tholiformis]|uniref:Uncharacterized protein n=1 Tax=Cyclostephanos tholiformis TaxID=382380 RepID=A0ABD3R777_9STRA